MSKFTEAEQLEFDDIHKFCEKGSLDKNYLAIYDFISDKFTLVNKKNAFAKIIQKIMNKEMCGICNKCYYEVIYINEIIKLTIDTFRNTFPLTEVKQSNIHGHGVFAKENIAKNRIITFYPVHYIIDSESKNGAVYLSPEISDLQMNTFKISDYILTGPEIELLQIGGHPEMYKEFQNGHIINHSNKANTFFRLVNGNKDCLCNVWLIVSTRDIKKGEELTVNYGPRWNKILNG